MLFTFFAVPCAGVFWMNDGYFVVDEVVLFLLLNNVNDMIWERSLCRSFAGYLKQEFYVNNEAIY